MDLLLALPRELSFKILTNYVPLKTLGTLSTCCRSYRDLINQDVLWRYLCKKYGFDESLENLAQEPPLELSQTPSMLNPQFNHSCFLPDSCRFKRIFAYGFWADRNWKTGRYAVGPVLKGHTQQVTALGCTNRLVVTGSENGSLNVYDMVSAQLLYTLEQSGQISQVKLINGTSWNPEDDPDLDPVILTSSLDGYIRTYDATFGMLQTALLIGKPVSKICLLENVVVAATTVGSVEFWNISTQNLIERFNIHEDEIECLASYGLNLVASGGWDHKLVVMKCQLGKSNEKGKPQHPVQIMFRNQLHDEAVTACCFGSEKRLLSGSADGTVRFWDIHTARCIATGRGHQPSSEIVSVPPF